MRCMNNSMELSWFRVFTKESWASYNDILILDTYEHKNELKSRSAWPNEVKMGWYEMTIKTKHDQHQRYPPKEALW